MDIPEGTNHSIKHFSQREIETITSQYKTMIGQGAFGKVYKGTLEDKSMVAVKKINLTGHSIKENFVNEVSVHSQINHRSVTRLIGYCYEEDALMMVIEYISGGNLNDFLHNNDRPIHLGTRLRIAVECAEALDYMHSYMRTRLIHGDIKPANILLDQHLNAKISDFGISRLINTDVTLYTDNVKGSIGYMDPLFAQTGRLTTKSDVYSFGVVLVELFTRKRGRPEDGEDSIANIFTRSLSKGFRKARNMFDTEIAEQRNLKILEGIGKLAVECLSLENHKRPEMTNVAERLRTLRKALDRREEKIPSFFWRTNKFKHERYVVAELALASEQTVAPASNPTTVNKLVRLGSAVAVLQLDLEELLRAPAEVLGKGVLGTTYKAMLESDATVVVKRLKGVDDLLSEEEFGRRAMAIGAIESEFVLLPRWYYFSKDEVLFFYDYMPKGSLATLLHDTSDGFGGAELDWEQRSTIALTAARGLLTIHSSGAEACHGNIKSSNVFVTSAYEARLSEHGLVTLMASSCYLRNPSGYHAPEVDYVRSVSQEADVYSFGVLLLELLTGKRPTNHDTTEGIDLPLWVQSVPREEWMAEVIDSRLLARRPSLGEETTPIQLMELAMACCKELPTQRPAISQVLKWIEYIGWLPVSPVNWSNICGSSLDGFATPDIDQRQLDRILHSPSDILGTGTFGITTKNELDQGTVTVKTGTGINMSKTEYRRRMSEVIAVRHEHVLPLRLGYYLADETKVVLLYDYMPLGSLANRLHGNQGSGGMAPLDRDRRLTIALSVARGVASIHSVGPSRCHGNIKSSNVFLTGDHNEAILSEHGIAALADPSSFVRMRTSGYLAREVIATSRITQEADVYSFGILLIELLTGRVPTTAMDKGLDLSQWLCSIPRESWPSKALDSELVRSARRQQQQKGAMAQGMLMLEVQLLRLAMDCCTSFDLRPAMATVVRTIETL